MDVVGGMGEGEGVWWVDGRRGVGGEGALSGFGGFKKRETVLVRTRLLIKGKKEKKVGRSVSIVT